MTSIFECRKCRNKIEKEVYFEYGSDIPLPLDLSCYICGNHNFLDGNTHQTADKNLTNKDDSNKKDNLTPEQAKQEQEKEKQEALKQAEQERLLAQCSTPPQAQI
ncbi:hypothetical protein [Helicobacter sp. T3_23-1059]